MHELNIAVGQANRFLPVRDETRDAWPALIAAMRGAMRRGLSPRVREVQLLAQRWMDLLRDTVVYDPTLLSRYGSTHYADPDEPARNGVDPALLEFLSTALWAKHLTLDEIERLRRGGANQREWPRVIAAFREEMNRGTAVHSPRVQELLRQWEGLLDEMTQGDVKLSRKWITAVRSDPDLWIGSGVDGRLQHYIQRARVVKEERVA